MLDTKTWKNTMNSVGDWKIRWLRTLGWIQIKILIRSRKDVSKSDRCKWSEKSSFDSNSYFWSFDVIINKWNEMIEQVRNDENNISPRSPLYFGWDVKQLRFFENFISRGSKKIPGYFLSKFQVDAISGFQKKAKRKHDSRNNDKCISTTSNTIQILIIEFRNLKNTIFWSNNIWG